MTLFQYEYATEARQVENSPYVYRTFTKKKGEYASKYKLTMPILRNLGEIMEVDWDGSTLEIMDCSIGEVVSAHVYRRLTIQPNQLCGSIIRYVIQ